MSSSQRWPARLLALLLFLGFGAPATAESSTHRRPEAGSGGAIRELPSQTPLSPADREWLKIVSYIIEDKEKTIFQSLGTEWQREQFIRSFWKRRDPQPATPENEFYIEHMRRWAYANDVLGRDTPVPGWRTDRGRVYIVNGPPFKVYPYPNTQQLWPLEVWEYRDTPRPGMPSFYQIIFFKPRVFNEWRLYSPAVDGLQALVIASPADMELVNFQDLAIKFPIVFAAARRVSPGYGPLDSEAVIARTMSPPPPPRPLALEREGGVETAFLPRGALEVGLTVVGFAHQELEGFLDLAVEVPSTETTFVELEDSFIANYEIEFEIATEAAGTWRRKGSQVVVRIPREEFDEVRDLPILYRQRLWLLPGQYRVRALLTEAATGRVGVAEAKATVPALSDLVVGAPELFYMTEDGTDSWQSFIPWVGPKLRRGYPVSCLVRVAARQGAAPGEALAAPTGLELEYRVRRDGETVWSATWAGDPAPQPGRDGWGVTRTLNLEALPSGNYELEVTARRRSSGDDSGVEVGPVAHLPIELVDEFLPFARILPVRSDTVDMAAGHDQIGQQFLRRNDFVAARAHFQAAVRLDSQNPAYQVDVAKTSVIAGDLGVAEFFLERVVRKEPGNAEAWATYGLLRVQKRDFPGAIEAYQRSLDLAPGTPAVYNGLAEAFLSSGQPQRALKMLDRSLEVNPDQQQVRQLRDHLKSEGDGDPSDDSS